MNNCRTCLFKDYKEVILDRETNERGFMFVCLKDQTKPQILRRPINNCTQYVEYEEVKVSATH